MGQNEHEGHVTMVTNQFKIIIKPSRFRVSEECARIYPHGYSGMAELTLLSARSDAKGLKGAITFTQEETVALHAVSQKD